MILRLRERMPMESSTRTPDGWPGECSVCGKQLSISVILPPHDAACPHCGALLWRDEPEGRVNDPIRRLAELGAHCETDDEEQVRKIQIVGSQYDDSAIRYLKRFNGVKLLDVRETAITPDGVARLRKLLPETTIVD